MMSCGDACKRESFRIGGCRWTVASPCQRHWLRRAVLVCALLSSAALDVQANANSHAGPGAITRPSGDAWPAVRAALEVAGVRWLDTHDGSANGVVFRTALFVSEHDAVALAAQLSRITGPLFSRLLTLPGQLVLSGVSPDGHWLASISPGPDGSRGYVSLLDMRATTTRGSNGADAAILAGTAPIFSFEDHAGRQRVRHQVYNIAGHSDGVKSDVLRRLRKLGWVRDDMPSTDGMGWSAQRGGQQLSIAFAPQPTGQIIYARQVQEGQP